jgi:primosomal protein N' (replication factor Y)
MLLYPPFSHLVRVELAGPDAGEVERDAGELHSRLERALPAATELLGPAPRFRVRGRHRRQLLLKGRERAPTVAAVRDAVEAATAARALRGSALSVDVDPH